MDIHESLTTLDYGVILVYLFAVITLGFWVSMRKSAQADLFLGGRRLGWFNIGLSIFGTNVSPSMMIGAFGFAYAMGIVGAYGELFAWFYILLLSLVFVPHYLNTGISTMPEFLDRRYDTRCRNFLSYYTLFSTMALWIGGTTYAGGILMSQIMGWPVWVSILALMFVATSFTVAGGFNAVVVTDAFQSVLMILAAIVLTVIGFIEVGGIEPLAALPEQRWDLFLSRSESEMFQWSHIVFGYMVTAIWFWCTDQTIVQRVLGARDLKQAQLGTVFAGYLKVITPFIYFLPGIFCYILFPDLDNQDEAYMTMVSNLLPVGVVGLTAAVLIAALISTVDSGLNSLSTVFTLDIYRGQFSPDADATRVKRVGRMVTVVTALIASLIAISLTRVETNIFITLQTVISYLSPGMAAVFIVGVLWKRANAEAAFSVLVGGNLLSVFIGFMDLSGWLGDRFLPMKASGSGNITNENLPLFNVGNWAIPFSFMGIILFTIIMTTGSIVSTVKQWKYCRLPFLAASSGAGVVITAVLFNEWAYENYAWPSFLLMTVLLFVIMLVLMVGISLTTTPPPAEKRLPSVLDTFRTKGGTSRVVIILWGVLALVMAGIYLFFQR